MTYTLPPARTGLTFGKTLRWTGCIALALLLYWRLQPSSAKEVVRWRPTLAAAQAEAAQSRKLVFADFGATWCPPCQQVRRDLWSNSGVADALDAFVPVELDVDKSPQAAQQYQVSSIPAFFLLDSQGRVLKRSEGAMSKSEFLDWLKLEMVK